MAPVRWNRTTTTLVVYRFEVCTQDHSRSARRKVRISRHVILTSDNNMSHHSCFDDY